MLRASSALLLLAACIMALSLASGVSADRDVSPPPAPLRAAKGPAAGAGAAAAKCAWRGYDLSSLMGVAYPGRDGSALYNYSVSVCSPLWTLPGSPPAAKACAGSYGQAKELSAVCQQHQVDTWGVDAFNLGNWDGGAVAPAPQWGYIDPLVPSLGIQYTLTGAKGCFTEASGGLEPYTSRVQFACSRTQSEGFTVQQASGKGSECTFNLTMRTPLACPGEERAECEWNGFDFSPLVGREFPGSDGGSLYSYALSICAPLSPKGKGAKCVAMDADASVCQMQEEGTVGPDGGAYDIGRWNSLFPASWDWADEAAPWKGVRYSLQGARTCWASGQPDFYYANVALLCARNQGDVVQVSQNGGCTQTYTLATPLACPDMRKAPGARGEGKQQQQPTIRLSEQ